MSYILEALKKAQAERQLGSAPTLHAMPIHAGDTGAHSARPRNVGLAIAGAVLGLAAIAVLVWWQQAAPTPAAAPAPPAAPAASALARPAPNPPYQEPQASHQEPQAGRVGSATAEPTRTRAPAHPAPPVAAAKPVPAAAAKPAPLAEDLPPTLRELPDNIQREIPAVAIGGYIYSKNAEDRLLLVDKALRHEGEEVAPGLTLEKLLPKAAVMRYKGYRYRVPY